jgi:hypothetical protein
MTRFRNRLRDRRRAGTVTHEEVEASIAAWTAHASTPTPSACCGRSSMAHAKSLAGRCVMRLPLGGRGA